MGPLSAYYSQEVKIWLRNNPGRVVTQYQIGKLFGTAYAKAATLQISMSGFRKTGIYPTNPDIFSDHDFCPAETTDNEPSAVVNVGANEVPPATSDPVNATESNDLPIPAEEDQQWSTPPRSSRYQSPLVSPRPGPSGLQTRLLSPKPGPSGLQNKFVSPEDISPIPKANRMKNSRKRGKTAVLTSSPYKTDLQDALAKKKKPTKVKAQAVVRIKELTEAACQKEDNCLYCQEPYSATTKKDGWVQCLTCRLWAHESCTCLKEEDLDDFKCDKCIKL